LFSAAPSVALAFLGLAVLQHGNLYASIEATSMVLGAPAFILYAWIVFRSLFQNRLPVLAAGMAVTVVWLVSSLGPWAVFAR
jgi:hypothetical protein